MRIFEGRDYGDGPGAVVFICVLVIPAVLAIGLIELTVCRPKKVPWWSTRTDSCR